MVLKNIVFVEGRYLTHVILLVIYMFDHLSCYTCLMFVAENASEENIDSNQTLLS